jgi:ribosome assembly protein 1
MWGHDYYYDGKTKCVQQQTGTKKKCVFVQMILDNIWSLYDAVLIARDTVKTQKVIDNLQIQLSAREQRHKDVKVLLQVRVCVTIYCFIHFIQAIMCSWLPLSACVLNAVCRLLPSPMNLDAKRVDRLLMSSSSSNVDNCECLVYFIQL